MSGWQSADPAADDPRLIGKEWPGADRPLVGWPRWPVAIAATLFIWAVSIGLWLAMVAAAVYVAVLVLRMTGVRI